MPKGDFMSIDIKLMNQYINGSILDEDTLNKLENDYNFMKNCIILTGDKKLYNLCSDELKNNFDFIYFLIQKFYDDDEFIDKLIMNYIEQDKKNNNRVISKTLELALVALDNLKNDRLIIKYRALLYSTYKCETIVIRNIIYEFERDNEYKKLNLFMKGFIILYNDFIDSKLVLNYMSKLFLNEIVNEHNLDIEELLHNNFLSYEDLKSYGLNCFIIDYVKKYDRLFSDYLSCNIDIINNYIDIDFIKKHWDIYNKNNERKLYINIIYDVHDYFINNGEDILFGEDSTLYYLSDKYNILDKIRDEIKEPDNINFDGYMKDTKYLFESAELNDEDQFHLMNIKNIFESNLNGEKKTYLSKDKLKNIILVNKKNKNN